MYPANLLTSSLVTIRPTDPAFKAACYRLLPLPASGGSGSSRGCVIKLAIYGDGVGAGAQASQAYTLTVASTQPTLLRMDVPVTGTLAGGGRAASYRVYLALTGSDNIVDVYQHSLRVALTQFSGHVQARLSCRAIQSGNVTRATSEWSMSADDWPVLDVPLLFALEKVTDYPFRLSIDIFDCINRFPYVTQTSSTLSQKGCFGRNVAGGSAGKGYLYVLVETTSPSVQPIVAAASFSLMVSVVPANASSHTTLPPTLTAVPLSPGVPASGRVAEGQFAYYIVRPGEIHQSADSSNQLTSIIVTYPFIHQARSSRTCALLPPSCKVTRTPPLSPSFFILTLSYCH